MPRVGRNPLTREPAPYHFPPVLLAVITHLPNVEGYHAQRREIVAKCIETMKAGAPGVPLLVWDNGSFQSFKEFLTPFADYFIQAPNIGKQAARAALLRMLPPETIVALSDDDMEYSAGWLDESLKLLKGFPNVGAVSCYPVRPSFGWGIETTLEWARRHATLEQGTYIPDEWHGDYLDSVGGRHDEAAVKARRWKEYRITYKGMQAYPQAQHCQMICYAGRLADVADYDPAAMGVERPFDEAIDRAGLLRLTTIERLARHMGNVLDG